MITRLLNLPIEGEGTSIKDVDVLEEHGKIFFVADADICCDGSGGNPDNDPYFQPDTAYHYQGQALNAYKVPFIVVPKSIINAVKGIVLGCKARMTYIRTKMTVECIVGDIGPSAKIGECSPRAAQAVMMNPNPVHGGEDDYNMVLYEIFPGVETTIEGIKYPLQPS